MSEEQLADIKEAKEILDQYTQKCSTVDEGNLFFAATQLEAALSSLQAELNPVEICYLSMVP